MTVKAIGMGKPLVVRGREGGVSGDAQIVMWSHHQGRNRGRQDEFGYGQVEFGMLVGNPSGDV